MNEEINCQTCEFENRGINDFPCIQCDPRICSKWQRKEERSELEEDNEIEL